MSQLEGTENRVAVARSDYNEVARSYNTKVQTFPTNILAGMFGLANKHTSNQPPALKLCQK